MIMAMTADGGGGALLFLNNKDLNDKLDYQEVLSRFLALRSSSGSQPDAAAIGAEREALRDWLKKSPFAPK